MAECWADDKPLPELIMVQGTGVYMRHPLYDLIP